MYGASPTGRTNRRRTNRLLTWSWGTGRRRGGRGSRAAGARRMKRRRRARGAEAPWWRARPAPSAGTGRRRGRTSPPNAVGGSTARSRTGTAAARPRPPPRPPWRPSQRGSGVLECSPQRFCSDFYPFLAIAVKFSVLTNWGCGARGLSNGPGEVDPEFASWKMCTKLYLYYNLYISLRALQITYISTNGTRTKERQKTADGQWTKKKSYKCSWKHDNMDATYL